MLGKDLFVQGQFQTQRIIKVDFIMVWSRQMYDLGYEQGKQLIHKRNRFLILMIILLFSFRITQNDT